MGTTHAAGEQASVKRPSRTQAAADDNFLVKWSLAEHRQELFCLIFSRVAFVILGHRVCFEYNTLMTVLALWDFFWA